MDVENCGAITCLKFLNGADFLLSCHKNGNVQLWDCKDNIIALAIEKEFESQVVYIHELRETWEFPEKKKWKLLLGDQNGDKWNLNIDTGLFMGYKYTKSKIFPDLEGVLNQVIENNDQLVIGTFEGIGIYTHYDKYLNYKQAQMYPQTSEKNSKILKKEQLSFSLIEKIGFERSLRNIVPYFDFLSNDINQRPERDIGNIWSYKLVVSWGNELDFLTIRKFHEDNSQFIDQENDDAQDPHKKIFDYKVEGQLRLDYKYRIVLVYELNYNYIILIDEDMGVTPLYINTKIFHTHFFDRRFLNQDIVYRGNIKSTKDGKYKRHYSNTVQKDQKTKRLYIVTKRIVFLKLLDWKGYIDRLQVDDRWIQAFSQFETIYNHRMRFFLGVEQDRKKQTEIMEPMLMGLIVRYVDANRDIEIEKQKEEEFERDITGGAGTQMGLGGKIMIDWVQIFSIVIEVQLKCGKNKEIFHKLKSLSENYERLNEYCIALKPHLLKNKIKKIDFDSFKEVAGLYTNRDYGKEVQSSLALNLDTSNVDKLFLVTICYERQLFLPLVYILTSDERCDYITCQNILLKRMQIKENDYEEMGYMILTIISYTFKKEWFNPENSAKTIPDKKFKEILCQIVIWFQEREIQSILLKFDSLKVYQVLELLFEAPCYDELTDNYSIGPNLSPTGQTPMVDIAESILFFIKEQSLNIEDQYVFGYADKKASFNIFDEENCESSPGTSEKNLDGFHNGELAKKIQRNFYYFFLRVTCKEKMLLKAKEVFESIEKLLGMSESEGQESGNTLIQSDYYDMETVLIDVLFQYGPRFLKSNIDSLKNWSVVKKFRRLESCIMFYHKDYKSAFKIQQNLSNSIRIQKFVFTIIKKEMDHNQKSLDKNFDKNFKESVLYYLRDQLILDKTESESILDVLFAFQEMELIDNLKGYPDLQFEYIEKLLKKDNFNLDLREQYQDLMCRLKPKRFIQELFRENYELDILIKASEKYNIKKALCILYKKIGNNQLAIGAYLQIQENIITKVKDLGILTIKLEGKQTLIFEDSQQVLKGISEPNYEQTENIWFIFINGLIKLYCDNKIAIDNQFSNSEVVAQRIFDQSSHCATIIGLLWNYQLMIMKTMHNYVRIERFHEFYQKDQQLDRLEKRSQTLQLKQLVTSLDNEKGLYKYSSESCADTLWEINNELMVQQRRGYKPAPHCQYCNKRLKEDHYDVVMFRVKENYDKDCFHLNCREMAFESGLDKEKDTKRSRSISVSTWDKGDVGDDLEEDLVLALNDLNDLGGLISDKSIQESPANRKEDTIAKIRMKMKVADNIIKKYDQEVIFQ